MIWIDSHIILIINGKGREVLLVLPRNPKFPQLVGNVIEGKYIPDKDGYDFVGFEEA